MKDTFLSIHSILRWFVLLFGLLAIIKYFIGWNSKKAFTKGDKKFATLYTISLDIQLLVGLVLYIFLSDLTKAAFSNMGAAMKDTNLRFYTVEHTTVMLLAIIIAHVGSVMSRKAATDAGKYKTGFIYFSISFILILMSIPWPFREAIGRSLFRVCKRFTYF